MKIPTIYDNLQKMANAIKEKSSELIVNHSSVCKRQEYENIRVISVHGNYIWQELSLEGQKLKAQVLSDYKKYSTILKLLISELTDDSKRKFNEAEQIFLNDVNQDKSTWSKTNEEARQKVCGAIDHMQELLLVLSSSQDKIIVVPDTNALLYNSTLEKWSFDDANSFVIILLPTILSELDQLKINHRNDDVRQKAESLIRQIKEYRRRGSLETGVPIVKDKIILKAVAVEPRTDESLPWLVPSNADDRFLAGALEIMRQNIRSAVIIVTRDINMQNKADFALIPFWEPPEPISKSIKEKT